MSEAIPPINGQITEAMTEVQPITPEQVTKASTVTAQTAIATVADLRTASPKLWKAITMGLAMQIRNQQEASNRRIKEIMQRAARDSH